MNDEKKDRTLSLKRTFEAPVTLVWEAWTQSEHIAAWWAPKGMKIEIAAHDFRVGGKWKYTMPRRLEGSKPHFISSQFFISSIYSNG